MENPRLRHLSIRKDSKYASKNSKGKSATGFDNYICADFKDIGSIIDDSISYTAGKMLNGHRKKVNYVSESMDIIMYDVDDGKTLQEMAEILKDYNYWFITTTSHSEKLHKFRILIPLETPFPAKYDELYPAVFCKIGNKLGIPFDPNVTDICRFFVGLKGVETYYNDGKTIDIMPYFEQCDRILGHNTKFTQTLTKSRKDIEIVYTDSNQLSLHELAMKSKYINHLNNIISSGSLNKYGYKLGCYLMAAGISRYDTAVHLEEIKDSHYTGSYDYGLDYWNKYLPRR